MTFVLFRYIPRSGVEIEQVPPVVFPIPLPHVLNLPIICEKKKKNLARRISLIIEVRKCRSKEKQSNRTKQ